MLQGVWNIEASEPRFTCSNAAEAGTTLVFETTGSGDTLGDQGGSVKLSTDPSGQKVAGIASTDVIDIDETAYNGYRNHQKVQQKIGERVNLITKGFVTTNKVTGTPTLGDTAYLTANGVLTPTLSATGGLIATPKVGRFDGGKDADGYVTVSINIPG